MKALVIFFENEVRQNVIISKLDDVIYHLEYIQKISICCILQYSSKIQK